MELKTKSIKGMTLALLMLIAAMAGCIGSEEDDTETEDTVDAPVTSGTDAGYTYASVSYTHLTLPTTYSV